MKYLNKIHLTIFRKIQCPSEITHIITLLALLQIPVVGESLCVML